MLKDSRFWLGVVIAFVIGLGLGLGLYVWRVGAVRADAEQRAERAEKKLAELEKANGDLDERLASAEASASEMESELTKVSEDDEGSAVEQQGQQQQDAGPAPKIVSRSVDPEMVAPGDKMKLAVKTKGGAEKVRMRVVSRDSTIGYDKSWYLTETSSSGGSATWSRTISAPGDPGEYRYFATAWGSSQRVEMSGVSAWTFVVELP